MAEKEKEDRDEGDGETSKGMMVAHKLLKNLGDNKEGECIMVPKEVGDALIAGGIAELASEEDVQGTEDTENQDEYATEPVVANAVGKLKNTVEKTVAEAVAKAAPKSNKELAIIPAQVKTGPIFKSMGEYVRNIYQAQFKGDNTSRNKVAAYQNEAADAWTKLGYQTKAPPLGVNETTQSQGGFLVNPQFSPDVYVIPHGQIDLQAQAQMLPTPTSNVFNQRFVNESSLANGSIFGGLNMVAAAEGGSLTSSLPAWNNIAFTLQKLVLFVYYTSEVLEDAYYPLEREVDEYAQKAFIYGINTQIIQGTTLEGLLNSPGLVTVTKSANDTAFHTTAATSLTYADLSQIWASVYLDAQVSDRGIWLFHPSLASPLVQMTYTFSGSAPAWGIQYDAQMGLEGAGSGFPGTPYKIFGKKAYPCWACSAPGNAGDILYVDFNTVKLYKRPYRVEMSKEFQFGTDQVAIRYVNRLDCKTVWRNTIVGPNGTQSFSAVVTRSSSGT